MTLMSLIWQYIKPHGRLLVGVVIFQLAQSVASLYLPTLNAQIIDKGVATGDTGFILSTGALMLAITFVQIICAIIAVYFGAKAAMGLGRDLRSAVFHRVGQYSEREVTLFGAPSLITRNTNDVQQVQMLVLLTCTILVSAPMLSIGGIVMALSLDLQLSWIIAVAVPVLLIAMGLVIVRMVPLYRLMQVRIDKVNGVLREQLMGIRVIRAFVRESRESARFGRANADVTDTALRAGRLFALMFPLVLLILNISSVAVLWFGAYRIDSGSMDIGTLIAFLTYLMQILMSVMMASMMAFLIPRASVCADRIAEVLDTESTVVLAENGITEFSEKGTIVLDGVSFAYPGAEMPVLHELTFVAQPGKTTAIVGSTGSGKTTLINLLPRLFDATDGTVAIDGVNVRDADADALWSRIGLVPQKPYLFSGTVASNLRYGKPDATDDELWAALETAQAKDFVSKMAGGLEADISQGGTNVSGGQRQRLAIARAIVKRPEIYIFDDSFSALDLATDARLRKALHRDVRGATIIVVAQRISTIVEADQILVLENGHITARGTSAELLETSQTYREIVESQLSTEEAA